MQTHWYGGTETKTDGERERKLVKWIAIHILFEEGNIDLARFASCFNAFMWLPTTYMFVFTFIDLNIRSSVITQQPCMRWMVPLASRTSIELAILSNIKIFWYCIPSTVRIFYMDLITMITILSRQTMQWHAGHRMKSIIFGFVFTNKTSIYLAGQAFSRTTRTTQHRKQIKQVRIWMTSCSYFKYTWNTI